LVKWVIFAGALVAFDGLVGLAVATAVGVALWLGQSPRHLLVAGAVLLALVPIAVLIHGLPSPDAVGPGFVLENKIANHLAFAGLAFFVSGLLVSGVRERERERIVPPEESIDE
jgi:hypothetical protein